MNIHTGQNFDEWAKEEGLDIEPLPLGFYAIEGLADFCIVHWEGNVLTMCRTGHWCTSQYYPTLDSIMDRALDFGCECWYLGE